MNKKEKVGLTGKLEIKINGKVVRKIDNLIVDAGLDWVASRMGSASSSVMTHMAVGTGTTAAVVGNTTLETENFRQVLSVSGGTVLNDTVTFESTYAAGDATAALTEAGIFNDVLAGDMLARTVFAVINKGVLDVMTVSWVITIA